MTRLPTIRAAATALVAVILGAVCYSQTPATARQPIDEYALKAAFLYNFAKFVAWPAGSFRNSTDPLRVCVLGENRFGRGLEDALRGKDVGGRPLIASQVATAREGCGCQMLFISSSEKKRLGTILEELRGSSVLTVGETEGFAERGGIMNLKVADGRIRLEVNITAADQSGLRISAKLLSLARTVR